MPKEADLPTNAMSQRIKPMCDIYVEHGRLDIDRHVRLRNASFLDQTSNARASALTPAALTGNVA
jgi:hypothetical protein